MKIFKATGFPLVPLIPGTQHAAGGQPSPAAGRANSSVGKTLADAASEESGATKQKRRGLLLPPRQPCLGGWEKAGLGGCTAKKHPAQPQPGATTTPQQRGAVAAEPLSRAVCVKTATSSRPERPVWVSGDNKSVQSAAASVAACLEGPLGARGVPAPRRLLPRSIARLHKLLFVCAQRAKPPPSQAAPPGQGSAGQRGGAAGSRRFLPHAKCSSTSTSLLRRHSGSARPCGRQPFFFFLFGVCFQ